LTEQGIIALSGHRDPDAARGYIKRTEIQRAIRARKRRAWVEASKIADAMTVPAQPGNMGRQEVNK
jgi:hypothetical protein